MLPAKRKEERPDFLASIDADQRQMFLDLMLGTSLQTNVEEHLRGAALGAGITVAQMRQLIAMDPEVNEIIARCNEEFTKLKLRTVGVGKMFEIIEGGENISPAHQIQAFKAVSEDVKEPARGTQVNIQNNQNTINVRGMYDQIVQELERE